MPAHAPTATSAPPNGTVTFLFAEVEESPRAREQRSGAMRPALVRYEAIVREAVERGRGRVVRAGGDGCQAAFHAPADAAAAALALQRELARQRWPTPTPILARVALHTGPAELRGDG